MLKRDKFLKLLLIVSGITALVVLAVFATVGNGLGQPENVATKSKESLAGSQAAWDAIFTSYYGKDAQDFTVVDIKGKKHKLSDYRGRNVVVVFWATWCPACNLEIPHLIKLRNTFEDDELALLAISNEEHDRLKDYAESKGINYTVASIGNSPLPEPFANVTAIPTNFFIGPDGKIKLAAVGIVPPDDAKKILGLERQETSLR